MAYSKQNVQFFENNSKSWAVSPN